MRILFVFLFFIFSGHFAQAANVCVKEFCVDAQVVSSIEDMQRGLQGRDGLLENQGMLFDFKEASEHHFWMKDMKFAIDMILLDAQGKIIFIAPSKKPCQSDPCEIYGPSEKSSYVLEVVSGFAATHQLKEGDTLLISGIN